MRKKVSSRMFLLFQVHVGHLKNLTDMIMVAILKDSF